MIRTSPFRFLLLVAVCLALTSCATYTANTTPAPSRTAYEQANLNFAALAADYKVWLQGCIELRRNHALTEAQWKQVVEADNQAKTWAPIVHDLLDAWSKFGDKPSTFDEANLKLASAQENVHSVKVTVEAHQ